ncbi:hypothetical protein Tdes44962_MAKER10467 [Teratosphaeria destructans]|uniref:Uncharacterized protein n=1 Tax=Teratosphaeria destructans TaxID=418781 RepID=A0A9W7W778_9PEZI|nr:hypothetical protein Tdes44962_MAKER10467 [Teratosphaeria destructans]
MARAKAVSTDRRSSDAELETLYGGSRAAPERADGRHEAGPRRGAWTARVGGGERGAQAQARGGQGASAERQRARGLRDPGGRVRHQSDRGDREPFELLERRGRVSFCAESVVESGEGGGEAGWVGRWCEVRG